MLLRWQSTLSLSLWGGSEFGEGDKGKRGGLTPWGTKEQVWEEDNGICVLSGKTQVVPSISRYPKCTSLLTDSWATDSEA